VAASEQRLLVSVRDGLDSHQADLDIDRNASRVASPPNNVRWLRYVT
jgi:hypothetical protein